MFEYNSDNESLFRELEIPVGGCFSCLLRNWRHRFAFGPCYLEGEADNGRLTVDTT